MSSGRRVHLACRERACLVAGRIPRTESVTPKSRRKRIRLRLPRHRSVSQQTSPPAQPSTSGNPDSQSEDAIPTVRLTVNEVRVVFTVTDKHGHYIKDLKEPDFKVIDDRKPAEMRSFRSETDLPLQVGLLIDASNSVRDRFKFEQEAAIEFLNATIRPQL